MTRGYDNSRRARAAAETADRVALATEALLAEVPIASVTLKAIAARAGVTVQTVLRHMGSRDGCVHAVGERLRARVDAQRGHPTPGDVRGAIDGLLLHYETDGRLVLNLLAQEAVDPLAGAAVAEGRAHHRAWAARSFAPRCAGGLDHETLDALVAATDLYLWKLLRLDLGRSREATRAVMERLVHAVLESA